MLFPTENSVLLPAMVPGDIILYFNPRGKDERVLKILHQGRDISRTGLVTKPAQKIVT